MDTIRVMIGSAIMPIHLSVDVEDTLLLAERIELTVVL